MRFLPLFFLLAISAPHQVGGELSRPVKVFWIPPQIETYVPVTPENIEEVAFKIIQINNSNQAKRIVVLIQGSNQAIDSKRIRIKISTENKFYNFDSNGIGVSSSGESVKVDLKKLQQELCE